LDLKLRRGFADLAWQNGGVYECQTEQESGIGGQMVTVAALSLALNLLLTGVFIVVVKRLLNATPPAVEAL
jgi:hypothetical protein